ncbi:hypothetical protein KEM55_001005 [Ascosphaera atra]|nr:hypothetical protein KEM55_001005 [Ascosphaera atra]
MAPKTVGTLLANNHYVWYGKISARLRSSRGAGVVTAFILMSDVKDEIDFEFVGADLKNAETNYYFQGIPIWTNQISASLSDTFANYHDYEIDWKPDHITWSIDGQEVRTLKKSDTYNETTKQYDFPQSPSRVQLSLWPAGLESAAKGTIEWGGGLVDWESDDVKKNGYYYALVDKVSIECYDPPSSAGSGSKSYVYKNYDGTEDSVELSDKITVLKSFYADGENPDRDPNAPKPKTTTTEEPKSTKTTATEEDKKTSATETKTTASSTPTMNTDNLIPGLQGGGSPMRPNLGHDDDDKKDDKKEDDDDDDDDDDDKDDKKGSDNSTSNSGSSSSGSVTPSHPRPEDPDNTGFNQGVEASKNSASGVSGSVFAAVICIAALVVAL